MKFEYDFVETAILEYRNLSNATDEVVEDLKNIAKTLQDDVFWKGTACNFYKMKFSELIKNTDEISLAMKNVYLFLEGVYNNNKQMEERMVSRIMKG